jgi:hypothetical protein
MDWRRLPQTETALGMPALAWNLGGAGSTRYTPGPGSYPGYAGSEQPSTL